MDYNKVIQLREQANNVQKGAVIRKNYRADGYKNLLNKYGTTQDNSEAYFYEAEGRMPDMELTRQYETNGLFAKIVDTPADEALRTGFELGINDDEVKKRIMKKLIALDFDERCATAIKWARLYGGSIIVMMIDDGRELNQPVDWKNVKDIDELLVFERAIVMPDYTSLYQNYGEYFSKHTKSRFGMPKYYNVYSINGYFTVHESRCLVFKNGTMPQNTMIAEYRFWGIPEYLRIKRELKDTVTTHGNATKLLERSVQAVYKMKDLAQLLATDEGEDAALMRLQLIDMARGFLNTIAIDGEGEDYGFQSFTLSGVKEVVDTTCQMLSAITQIPQTILFGRSPAGMNSTGDSDLENYYNFVGRIRTQMIKHNLEKLIDIICIGEVNEGNMKNIPDFELEFLPLWSLTEEQQVNVDATKASTAQTKASTAQLYIEMGVLDPTEVRRGLMSAEDYKIETLIDENDEEDVLSPEERSALLQMKLQDEQGGSGDMAQMMAMQGGGEAMQGNVPMMPQNAENGQEMNAEKPQEDEADDDGIIVKNGKVFLNVAQMQKYKIKNLDDEENATNDLTKLQKCSNMFVEDGKKIVLKDGEHWVTTENGHKIIVDRDGNAVGGNEHVMQAITELKGEGTKVHFSEVAKLMMEWYKSKAAPSQNTASTIQSTSELEQIAKKPFPSQKNYKTFEEWKAATDEIIQARIKCGRYPLTIDSGKQEAHIKGSVAYNGRVSKGQITSYLNISVSEAQALVKQYAGTGEIENANDYPYQVKEIITCDREVGACFSTRGEMKDTKSFKIHYSKSGTHIVPYVKEEEK